MPAEQPRLKRQTTLFYSIDHRRSSITDRAEAILRDQSSVSPSVSSANTLELQKSISLQLPVSMECRQDSSRGLQRYSRVAPALVLNGFVFPFSSFSNGVDLLHRSAESISTELDIGYHSATTATRRSPRRTYLDSSDSTLVGRSKSSTSIRRELSPLRCNITEPGPAKSSFSGGILEEEHADEGSSESSSSSLLSPQQYVLNRLTLTAHEPGPESLEQHWYFSIYVYFSYLLIEPPLSKDLSCEIPC